MQAKLATKTLVIAVQYGRLDKTLDLLASINNARHSAGVESVIVNNGFHDFPDHTPLAAQLPEGASNVSVINCHNAGYFGGGNLGLKRFIPSQHSWVIVTNNDVSFVDSFFERLLSTNYPENCIVVPRIVGSDGVDQNPQYTDRIPFIKRLAFASLFALPPGLGWRLFKVLAKLFRQRGLAGRPIAFQEPTRVSLPLGAIFAIPAATMQRLGKLPDESFLYGEEMLLKKRLTASDGEFIMDPKLVVMHDESSTTNSLGGLTAWKMKRSAFFKYWRFYLFDR